MWSMKERYNSNSRFKIYFETLPNAFITGINIHYKILFGTYVKGENLSLPYIVAECIRPF